MSIFIYFAHDCLSGKISQRINLVAMITLRKLISFNRVSIITLQLFFFTSQAKRTLSEAAQKAVWASRIIDLIINCDIQSKSLRHRIVNMDIPSKKYVFDEAIEKDVKKMFTEGIMLRKEFANQNRFIVGTNDKNLFVFNPNYSVTRPIFYRISSFNSQYFISGEHGISKTVSIALYQHLSPYIHQFVFNSLKNPAQMEELITLQKEGLVERYAKCFYWSIGQPNFKEPNELLKEIISQLVQLPEETIRQLEKIKAEESLSNTLEDIYYQAQIQRTAIIDQINLAASMIRRWNDKLEQWNLEIQPVREQKRKLTKNYDELIQASSSKKLKEKIAKNKQAEIEKLLQKQRSIEYGNNAKKDKQRKQIKQPVLKVMDQMGRFREFGALQTYISSVNFERGILLEHQNIINLLIHNPKRIQRIELDGIHQLQLNFSESIIKQRGKIDFLDYFMFQLQRNMPTMIKYASNVMVVPSQEDLERYLHQEAQKHPLKGYYRFTFINQYFTEKIAFMTKQKQALEKSAQVKPVTQQEKASQILGKQMTPAVQSRAEQRSSNHIMRNNEKNPLEHTNNKPVQQFLVNLSIQVSILKDFDSFCLKKSKQLIKQFLEADKTKHQQKMEYLCVLFQLAKAHQKLGQSNLNFCTNVYNLVLGFKAESLFLDDQHNKELLLLSYDSKQSTINFHWTPSEFIQLTREFVQSSLVSFKSDLVYAYIKAMQIAGKKVEQQNESLSK